MPTDDRAIAICATFTVEAIEAALAFWIAELRLDYEIRFAGYSQIYQQLLDPTGLFARNRGGFNVALVRFDDWLRAGGPDGPEEHSDRLVAAIRAAAATFSVPLILVICPATPEHSAGFERAERVLREGIAGLPAVHVVDPAGVEAWYPVAQVHDPDGDELGHLPYTPEFFVALATAIARTVHAIAAPPYKVIALDCDDTLWSGICGEDGPHGVELDPPRRALQVFMAGRRQAGMLLTLCSKNNEEDVEETFAAHPEMPLRLADFAQRRINWEPKSANLNALAEDLDLALDSIILVDDNPKECTEAQVGSPGVLALPLPVQAEEIPEFLNHVWAFDRARVTEEDRLRPELYVQRAERAKAQKASANLEEFLASLQLEIAIGPMEPGQLERVAQLTGRTNQMNASCLRRTPAAVQDLLTTGAAECLTVSVRDRFGSYGLTGVIIFRCQAPALVADTFLLSCRVLGRGVEHGMVARLGELALERGLARVEIPFVATGRNRPAQLFLESIGVPLSAEAAAAVKYLPSRILPANSEWSRNSQRSRNFQPSRDREGAVVPSPDYVKIATELRRIEQIAERIRLTTRRPVPLRAEADPPRTALERDLAPLWAELLNLPAVGVHSNFFELGGHSLLAVQLLSRVRQIYQVDLSLEVVYSGEFTVAELAKAIELKEIEQAGGDYQGLLNELDSLSDEEARAMLTEEQDAT
ncbi:MAG TPA: HAD-IIIC family phosphatase [Candidatus Acidoferrales bacterium]|nr:HAD-IIIC family phosphatase [Candidatus Acidoferrales bacterium]